MSKMTKSVKVICISVAFLPVLLLGCSKTEDQQPAATSAVSSDQRPSGETTQVSTPDAADVITVTGKVKDIEDGGGFTFIFLEREGEEGVWAALPSMDVQKGKVVTLLNANVFPNFYSKTLDKTFEKIIFSTGIQGLDGQKTVSTTANGMQKRREMPQITQKSNEQPEENSSAKQSFNDALQHESPSPSSMSSSSSIQAGSAKAIVPFEDLEVDRAPGDNGYTVAEIYNKADVLKGQTVAVKAKVVKVSPNIMGKNWIHLQDGTGDPVGKTHDLVVTTSALPEKDQVVIFEGKVTADKDFGAGYKYAVIMENAELSKN